jgi:hypothetical protein
MYQQDDKAAALSKMNLRKCICNGEATGTPCKHYWSFGAKTDALNAEFLNYGEKFRNCTLLPGYLVEWDGSESVPHYCDRYEPDSSILVRVFKWFLKLLWRFRRYNPEFEEYRPTTPEEVREITEQAHKNGTPLNVIQDDDPTTGKGIIGATASPPDMAAAAAAMLAKQQEEAVSIDNVVSAMESKSGIGNQQPEHKSSPNKPKQEPEEDEGGIFDSDDELI